MSDYFDASQNRIVAGSLARSSEINDLRDETGTAFDKLPDPQVIKDGAVTFGVHTGGSGTAFEIVMPSPRSVYSDGLTLSFIPIYNNTGATTINVDGLGAKGVKRPDGSDLAAADFTTGEPVTLSYNGHHFSFTGGTPRSFYDATAADAAAAAASEIAAGISESNAADSEVAAAGSAASALSSKNAAANSAASALTSKNDAAASENAAETAETGAASSAASALSSKNAAASSAAAAEASESVVHDDAVAAAGSAASALSSKNAAAGSASSALSSKNAAAGSAASALTSKNAASASEVAAAGSASSANSSKIAAAGSASSANSSKTSAAASAAEAHLSAASVDHQNIVHVQGQGLVNELLTYLKTLDGSGSGLDADLLDGKHGSDYLPRYYPTFVGRLYVNNSNTAIEGGGNSSVKIKTPTGYIDIGSQSSSTADFYTNKNRFRFNKNVYVGDHVVIHKGNANDVGNGINASQLQGHNDTWYRCSGCSWTCSSGCSGSCMAGCTGCSTSCVGGCTGCQGTCTGSCTGSCTGGCTSCTGCSGGCSGTCGSSCGSGCDGCSGV